MVDSAPEMRVLFEREGIDSNQHRHHLLQNRDFTLFSKQDFVRSDDCFVFCFLHFRRGVSQGILNGGLASPPCPPSKVNQFPRHARAKQPDVIGADTPTTKICREEQKKPKKNIDALEPSLTCALFRVGGPTAKLSRF